MGRLTLFKRAVNRSYLKRIYDRGLSAAWSFDGLGSFAAALTLRGAAIEHHVVPKDVKKDLGAATVLTVKRTEAVPSTSASHESLLCSASLCQRGENKGVGSL